MKALFVLAPAGFRDEETAGAKGKTEKEGVRSNKPRGYA